MADETTKVLKHNPDDEEVVDITQNIEVYFTKDIDESTLKGNMRVINVRKAKTLPGNFSYFTENSKVVFSIELLKENTPYRVEIDGVKDIDGEEVDKYVFEFRTKELEILEKHPPQIVKPDNNTVVDEPRISWTTFEDYRGNYDLEVATDSTFKNVVYSIETKNEELVPNIQRDKTYYARVKYSDRISDSIARDIIEIRQGDDELNFVHFDNYYEYKYGTRLYAISRAYVKADKSLEVIDSGNSDKGDIYIREDRPSSIIIDRPISDDDTIVVELYHYVDSKRKWSDTVSFYVKEKQYEDLEDIFDDDPESNEEKFVEIVEPDKNNFVSPGIDSITVRVNSDLIEKEDINIDISGMPLDLPYRNNENHDIHGRIKNFTQKSGYTLFDYVFAYINDGKITSFNTLEIQNVNDMVKYFSTIDLYNSTGDINTLKTIYNTMGNTLTFETESSIDTQEPYSVYTYDDLKRVGTGDYDWDLNSSYVQEEDIEVPDVEKFTPIGLDSDDDFTGEYDGNGYAIKNITIDKDESDIGFVSHNRGVIKNLKIINPDINGGTENTGSIVGVNREEGIISNVAVLEGNVYGYNRLGGLAGTNAGTIENSHANTEIYGDDNVGGIVGFNVSENIEMVYSASIVNGNDFVGGVIGDSTEYIESSYNFWDKDIGPDQSAGGTGLTTQEAKDIESYSFWDIEDVEDRSSTSEDSIWSIVDGETYPFLFQGGELDVS